MTSSASRLRSQQGFSLVEMMIVVGILGVLSGMAVIQIMSSLPGVRGDGGMRVVIGQFNQARQLAITQRRYMRVVITLPNQVTIIREDTPLTTTSLSNVILESNVQFMLSTGLPDTPDAFGKASAVDFGLTTTVLKFAPDGTLVNQSGQGLNGSVFMAIPNIQNTTLSARAITVLGSTGRVRGYRWDGGKWNVV
jgi:prepilin-type N-terminal cleavage/methylation domain-containing protein